MPAIWKTFPIQPLCCFSVSSTFTVSQVNEGFYFLILRKSDFDDFFLNVCIYILFEIRNILFGARKYLYCLNNNLLFMEKIPFSTIFISKIFFIWKLKFKE
jgi:hypothetical protein